MITYREMKRKKMTESTKIMRREARKKSKSSYDAAKFKQITTMQMNKRTITKMMRYSKCIPEKRSIISNASSTCLILKGQVQSTHSTCKQS